MGGQVKRARSVALLVALAITLSVLPAPTAGATGITIPPQIDHQAKTITFHVKLYVYPACPHFYCAVTDKIVGEIATTIENAWNNGLKFECYTIVVDLQITRGTSRTGPVDMVGILIDRSVAPIESHVATANASHWDSSDAADRLLPTNDSPLGQSTWGNPPIRDTTYAHELGHVLGLDDGYTVVDGVAVDRPGAPHDLMSTGMDEGSFIAQKTIDRLVHRAGITAADLHCDLGWNVKIVWTDVYDGVLDTITFDGVVDTVPLGDEFFGISLIGKGTASGSRGGWKACNPGIDVTPSGTVPATFLAILGDGKLTVSAYADLNTTLTGISTAQFTVDSTVETTQTADFKLGAPPPDTLCPHTSYGTATITPVKQTTP